MFTSARDDVAAITRSGRRVAQDMSVIVENLSEGRGTVGRLLRDDALYQDARRIADETERVVANLREVANQTRQAVTDFNGNAAGRDGQVQGLAADLRQTITHARAAMADLADNADALKRNFLFRGFFNRRGYFDLDDMDTASYRSGALEDKDRKALRIWVNAEYLFRTDERGIEQLTDEGKARIDSAMSQFVRYPPSSPLVIEGYAEAPTGDARYLSSRHRASLVAEYVTSKYSLDSNRVGIMALGSEAPQSPTGTTWRGVALALFAPR
jgi:phospholipid/cholesterol/gamma-HCH transport system substrate-binding protein